MSGEKIKRSTVEAHTKRLLDLGVEKTATEAHARAARVCREADNQASDIRDANRQPRPYERPRFGRRVRIESDVNPETGEVYDEKVETSEVDLERHEK